jgi:2,4-dienoyl-CoA reductase-like NADH-dependent reductase (Old Yellow Enzyme family)
MATPEGDVTSRLIHLYEDLSRGGVGLIISGHMYIHPTGKCHPEMTAVYDDAFLPGLTNLASAVHQAGGRAVVQINHGGMQCSQETVDELVAPSDLSTDLLPHPARALTEVEILAIISAYGQAARRVKAAGFDGVQIHGAHGYLVNQFLSPLTNHRSDRWGGSPQKRMQFLWDVASAVRTQVGPDYPVLIKLGLMDGKEGGLTLEESLLVIQSLEEMGIDGVEISGGIGGDKVTNIVPGIKAGKNEAYFLPWAQRARPLTRLPILLVGGFRTRATMQQTLDSGAADFISLCRPLISETDLPERMRLGLQDRSICISGNLCWAKEPGQGIACKCKVDRSIREKAI